MSPRCMITAAEVAQLIGRAKLDLSREARTQADLELFLGAHLPLGCTCAREVRLSAEDRPDFMVDERIAVEVKLKGARAADIARQLFRYAAHARVEAVILATNAPFGGVMPLSDAAGRVKPLHVVSLGRAWL